ncbi:MAG TPA: hypothetical protein P5526_31555 [Anaerolineae bacterium]|nr:hypothetical protein [Anaerolineae bacterium]
MKPIIQITTLLFFLLIVSACAAQPNTPAEAASAPTVITPAGDATTEAAAAAVDAALIWEGDPLPDDGQAECRRLEITPADQALIGSCGEAGSPVEFAPGQTGGWSDLVARLAPFEQTTDSGGRLVFNGQGEIAGPAWQRAIDAWAKTTLLELSSGRVSATGRTIMSWWLGQLADQPDLCRQLVVLDYGYAYANITPCEGGQATETYGGWVEPTLWEQFDGWLYANGQVYQANNYFSGLGQSEMSQAQVAELAQWAEIVYRQLAPAVVSQAAPLQAGPECPEVGKDALLFRNDAQGYCLLYPAGFTVEQPAANEAVIFAISLQDVSHPKAFIEVTDTDQTNPNDIVDAQVAEIKQALPDYEVQVTYGLLVDGQPAAQIDNAPGQDISRKLFIIRDDRLYTLTFVPADPAADGIYQEMEYLYTLVVNSFKFLPPQ